MQPSFRYLGSKPTFIDYTNWRGERGIREILVGSPANLYLGSTEWHPEEQYLLDVWDVEKQVERTFAMKGIHGWATSREALVAMMEPVLLSQSSPLSGEDRERFLKAVAEWKRDPLFQITSYSYVEAGTQHDPNARVLLEDDDA